MDTFALISFYTIESYFFAVRDSFKNTEKEVLKKEIFNIFLFNELQNIEELKRMKLPVSDIFSMRKNYAEQIRKSKFYKNTAKEIFTK